MRKVIPTVFAKSKKEFNERFSKLVKITRALQVDFMDGKFVKSKGIELEDIEHCAEWFGFFEAHLMVRKPKEWIAKIKQKGFNKVIFHFESCKNREEILEIIREIKNRKMKAWLAINPGTGVEKVLDFLEEIDGLLFMGVIPGKENQKFILSVLTKIHQLRRISRRTKIQVDGGVNIEVAKKLKKAGVDIINTGSFISKAENPKKALKELKKVFK